MFLIGKPYRSNESASLLTLLPVPEAFSTALAIVEVGTGNGRLLDIACSEMIPGAPHKKAVIAAVAHALATRLSLDSASNCVERRFRPWLCGVLKADVDPTDRSEINAEMNFILFLENSMVEVRKKRLR